MFSFSSECCRNVKVTRMKKKNVFSFWFCLDEKRIIIHKDEKRIMNNQMRAVAAFLSDMKRVHKNCTRNLEIYFNFTRILKTFVQVHF